MGFLDRLARLIGGEQRFNLGQYPQFIQDYYQQFAYAGSLYPLQLNQTMGGWRKTEEISGTLPNYITALRKSPPAFAAQMVRASVLSMARFTFRSRPNSSTPRRTFGNQDLRLLEQPWTNATTGELISRMEWSAGLAGNAYVLRQPDRLRVMRPDWVAIIYGSQAEPDDPKGALDGEVIGYAYKNGGFTQSNRNQMTVLLPEQVAHWSPLPDPMSPGLGMSWVTPALRDIQADTQALEHKLAYFSNGATPNLVVKGLPATTKAQFDELVDAIDTKHKGSTNAFKTLYLTAGADASVVGSNLAELDLTSITSHGETRVSFLSRVPAVILGISAGLKGSSLNSGNYAEARRNFADSWIYPTLRDLCAAVAPLIKMPGGAELWFDVDDIPLLREDAKDSAEIEKIREETIVAYVNGGFTAESAIAAVQGQNVGLLKHTDLVSVQLQPPGTVASPPPAPGAPAEGSAKALTPTEPPANGKGGARSAELGEALLLRLMESPVVHVAPAQVTNHFDSPSITVEAAQPPNVEIRLEQPINVAAAEPAQITNQFAPPSVQVDAPVTVETPDVTVNNTFEMPAAPAPVVNVNVPVEEPSQGVDLLYDGDKVIGTRPRSKGKR